MAGEILSLDTVEKISKVTKELEREKRNKNLLELENKELVKKNIKYETENYYLKKRDKTLTALENSLHQRIETYKSKNAPEIIIKELQLLSNMLIEEKNKLLENLNNDF